MADPSLSAAEVREFLMDTPEVNLLLDKEEFSDSYLSLCISLAVSSYNSITPSSSFTVESFPNKAILLYGSLHHVFEGRTAVAARNSMSYSDGGVSVPIEEKFEMYERLAGTYLAKFQQMSQSLKIQHNLESGWGHVSGDSAAFPPF